jgi:hypothetical protein
MIRKFLCALLHCCDKPEPLPEPAKPEQANVSFNSNVAEYRMYIRDPNNHEAYPRLVIKRVADGQIAQVTVPGEAVWPLLKIGIVNTR